MSITNPPSEHSACGVEEHVESNEYLAKRQLKKGTAGWLLLAGLGVSYVVSGDYSGWNFGLAHGGFGGLAIAAVIIAGMYLALVLGMAELSSALPAAGGGYTFARRALGPWGGFATGTAILIGTRSPPPPSRRSLAPTWNRWGSSGFTTAGGYIWRPTPSSSASTCPVSVRPSR